MNKPSHSSALYDFFDGTQVPGLVRRFLVGDFRTAWRVRYEQALTEFARVPFAVTFGAGRMAFYALLEAMGVGEGDEVVLPAYTCVVVPNAVLYRKAKPVYVDIRADTFNMDVSLLEAAITPRTKIILAQHTFGQPCEIEAIQRIAQQHGIQVIEDCSHAFGATYSGKPLGSFTEASFTSTDHSKVFSTGVGGFVLCKSPELAGKLRAAQERAQPLSWHIRLRIPLQYGLLSVLNRPGIYRQTRHLIRWLTRLRLFFYYRDELQTQRPSYYPTLLSNFQAFAGYQEVQRLEVNVAHRRQIAQGYHELFKGSSAVLIEGAWLRYSLQVKEPSAWERALSNDFVLGRWFTSITQGRTRDWEDIAYRLGSCPQGESAGQHTINFPTHFLVDSHSLERLREVLLENPQLKKDILIPNPSKEDTHDDSRIATRAG